MEFKGYNVVKLVFALVAGIALAGWATESHKTNGLLSQLSKQTKINATQEAILASDKADKSILQGQLAAAKQLGGTLVAGVSLKVPERDTVIVHDTIPTTATPDGSRTAAFADSTFAGKLEGKITAPPFPAPLGLSYTLTRPAFNPTIGFVMVDGQPVAVVEWVGEKYEIKGAYLRLPPEKRIKKWVEVSLNDQMHYGIGAGVDLRIGAGVSVGVAAKQPLVAGERTDVQVLARKSF
jgi:hypothetical protein